MGGKKVQADKTGNISRRCFKYTIAWLPADIADLLESLEEPEKVAIFPRVTRPFLSLTVGASVIRVAESLGKINGT